MSSKPIKTRRKKSTEVVEINKVDDVTQLIVRTINELRVNKIDTKVANCIFYGSSQLIKALEMSDLDRRLEQIENSIREDYTQ